MRRSTIVMILFVIVIVGVLLANQFLRTQPALELRVAVDPLGEAWLRDAVERFNAAETYVNTRRVRFSVEVISDLDVWSSQPPWTPADHPTVWIPASSASVNYATGVPVSLSVPSLAQTTLVWGGFVSRLNVLTVGDTTPFDWSVLQTAASTSDGSWAALGGEASWRFVKVAFASPERSIAGLGVLLSGAAAYHGNTNLTGALVGDPGFQDWLAPVIRAVPNFQTLGTNPAQAMSRGPSAIEFALLPESQWLTVLTALTSGSDPVRFSYPLNPFVFDFPLARWRDALPDEVLAAEALTAFLLSDAQQARLPDFGLRPAQTPVTADAALFAQGQAFGIQLAPDLSQRVQEPGRGDSLNLIRWFAQVAR